MPVVFLDVGLKQCGVLVGWVVLWILSGRVLASIKRGHVEKHWHSQANICGLEIQEFGFCGLPFPSLPFGWKYGNSEHPLLIITILPNQGYLPNSRIKEQKGALNSIRMQICAQMCLGGKCPEIEEYYATIRHLFLQRGGERGAIRHVTLIQYLLQGISTFFLIE